MGCQKVEHMKISVSTWPAAKDCPCYTIFSWSTNSGLLTFFKTHLENMATKCHQLAK